MKVFIRLTTYKIVVDSNKNHNLFGEWCPLKELVTEIHKYDESSKQYHEKVKRARERLYNRFGECDFR